MLLGQTQSHLEDDLNGLTISEKTVLQHVVQSDKKREQLLREERTLSAAIERTKDPTAAVLAYRQVCHERLDARTFEARRINLRRSGARGAQSRKVLLALEAEVKGSEERYLLDNP